MRIDPIQTAKDQIKAARRLDREGHAHLRIRGGPHGDSKYSRKVKHKLKGEWL